MFIVFVCFCALLCLFFFFVFLLRMVLGYHCRNHPPFLPQPSAPRQIILIIFRIGYEPSLPLKITRNIARAPRGACFNLNRVHRQAATGLGAWLVSPFTTRYVDMGGNGKKKKNSHCSRLTTGATSDSFLLVFFFFFSIEVVIFFFFWLFDYFIIVCFFLFNFFFFVLQFLAHNSTGTDIFGLGAAPELMLFSNTNLLFFFVFVSNFFLSKFSKVNWCSWQNVPEWTKSQRVYMIFSFKKHKKKKGFAIELHRKST